MPCTTDARGYANQIKMYSMAQTGRDVQITYTDLAWYDGPSVGVRLFRRNRIELTELGKVSKARDTKALNNGFPCGHFFDHLFHVEYPFDEGWS